MSIYRTHNPAPEDIRHIRSAVRRWADARGVPDAVRDSLLLVTSELTTNALRHAGTALEVAVVEVGGMIGVGVFDGDTRLPVTARAVDAEATSGRGLQIVEGIATRWGVERVCRGGITGKLVWAALRSRRRERREAHGSD